MSDKQSPGQVSEGDGNEADPSSLKGLTNAVGIEPAEPGQDPFLGRDIGGVTIVTLIAEGGMGRVYEGLQETPKRKVAVKVMRPGLVSRQAIQRFGMELEILGRLRHPCIAQIFSAGMCDVVGSKVPFFVMEYIPDALSITRYVKDRMLGTEARLALFQKVCEAVAHGHEQGIVHRDLKPSNILVEVTGAPKIIDFGIARTVGDAPEKMTALTELGQLIGTLQYMSPEQIDADPSSIDQRTDVYALGVILYELLTGARPYEISSQQIFEAAKIVRGQKPVSPLKLNSKLSPDIVRVTGTCLQKDRQRRYADAAELAFAVGHCLAGTPQPARTNVARQHPWRSAAWHGTRLRPAIVLAVLGGTLAAGVYTLIPSQPPAKAAAKAPAGAVFHEGRWYSFPDQQLTFTEAAMKAIESGGSLIRIRNQEENGFVAAHMHGPTWLGLARKDGKWVAVRDDSQIQTFFNWHPGQPSGNLGETACAITPDGKGRWHDYFPGDRLFYAIEW